MKAFLKKVIVLWLAKNVWWRISVIFWTLTVICLIATAASGRMKSDLTGRYVVTRSVDKDCLLPERIEQGYGIVGRVVDEPLAVEVVEEDTTELVTLTSAQTQVPAVGIVLITLLSLTLLGGLASGIIASTTKSPAKPVSPPPKS